MKKIITASLVTRLSISGVQASSLSAKLSSLEAELPDLKKQVKKQNKKINKVKAHDIGDNIKWGVDLRTAYDNINYDMANGTSAGNNDLYSLRFWLNMAYSPDTHNVFKGQLSMNKAFGADFAPAGIPSRAFNLGGMFDLTGNKTLTDNSLKVRQSYWLYLGDNVFGADMPWTFSLGRRPSTTGFLSNLREDDAASSPLAHVINVEFDGLSSKLDLSNVTGVPDKSIKLCMGKGSTNAQPLFHTCTPYRGFNIPGQDPVPTMSGDPMSPSVNLNASPFCNAGDMNVASLSVLVDGLIDEGYFSDAKYLVHLHGQNLIQMGSTQLQVCIKKC